MKKIICLALFLSALSAQSRVVGVKGIKGEWGSGGGNGLVCFTKHEWEVGGKTHNIVKWIEEENKNIIPDEMLPLIDTIEVYDLYEAKKRRGISSLPPEIVEIAPNEDIYGYIKRLGQRFERYVQPMNLLVENGRNLIPDSNIIFQKAPVVFQNDLGQVTLPRKNCVISTLAAQVNYHGHYEVHIDERLFNHPKHSQQSQATLILHELIYGIAREDFGHNDSGATRNIVRQLISFHSSINTKTVSRSLMDLKMSYRETKGLPFLEMWINSNFAFAFIHEYEQIMVNLHTSLENAYQSNEGKALLKLVDEAMIREGLKPLLTAEPSIARLEEKINFGVEESSQPGKWKKFKSTLDELAIDHLPAGEYSFERFQENMKSIIYLNVDLTTEQEEIFFFKNKLLFSKMKTIYTSGDFYKLYTTYIHHRQQEEQLRNMFYNTTCDVVTGQCEKSLKIDNIIPKS